ncbi:unnamed protein product [Didymodactylos carnosus]|uniref:Uncharacterized protein n=1 Tax=Didymodactylos carnosus TaxID=1234261 RepID=A0A8S2KPD8_9BILA|nr:unnamed protein product [Didymodactylos carnosus]CAF3861797.1 unnamed protein product [Didymodactylos carnosus]
MIDENDLPQENLSNDLSQLFAEQVILDPIYVLLGLNDLFKVNEQSEQIKSILEGFDVQFFHNTDDLNAHTKLRRAIQSFLIFIDNRLYIPERYQQFRTYRVNFRSIFKDDFNIFYRTYLSSIINRTIYLRISDDEDTPYQCVNHWNRILVFPICQ